MAQCSTNITDRIMNWYGNVEEKERDDRRQDGKTPGAILESTGLRVDKNTDRVMWRRNLISHTGDRWEKPRGSKI